MCILHSPLGRSYLNFVNCTIKTWKTQWKFKRHQSTYFHDMKQAFLSQAIFLFEEIVLRKRPCNISPDHFLAG